MTVLDTLTSTTSIPAMVISSTPSITSTTVAEGSSQLFRVLQCQDQFGNLLPGLPTVNWSIVSGGGTINSNGWYTAPSTPGPVEIEATYGAPTGTDGVYVSATNSFTVPNTPPTVATPAAATAVPRMPQVNLSVLGAGDTGEANLTYTWTTLGTPPAPVSFSAANGSNAGKNTTATLTLPGTYNFQVAITDSVALSTTTTTSITIVAGLAGVKITPASPGVAVGASQQFSGTAVDQFGNALATQPAITWSMAYGGVGGTISPAGLYTAPQIGIGADTVQASAGGVTSSALVNVTPPATSPFTPYSDIGSPSIPGSSSYNATTGVSTVSGGGADIWGKSDSFQFNYCSHTGDGSILAEVTSVQCTSPLAKAGVMFRDSTNANAAMAMLAVTPASGLYFETRSIDGGSTAAQFAPGFTTPIWLRLSRVGEQFAAYYSTQNVPGTTSWIQIGLPVTISAFSTAADTGLAVTAARPAALNASTFSDAIIMPGTAIPGRHPRPGLGHRRRARPLRRRWS